MTTKKETKKEIIKFLEEHWVEKSEQRFFQFLYTYTQLKNKPVSANIVVYDPFYYEDENILKEMKRTLKLFDK